MKIAFNPSTVAALTTPPNNKDITFDLRGRNIFARGVKFYGTDTNTWRDIKINNVSIGSYTLDLRNGSNTTLTNTNGIVTINSTWRPVVDNLTSDSTTSSLSAKQGKVLKALIDGKSNSDHNHDDRYYTKAESNAKYITDITTSVNKLTFTKNGSNIIRDITVNVVHSQGWLTNIPNKDATTKASPGLLIYESYAQTIGTNFHSSVLSINTGGTIQIAGNWGDDYARNLYWRSQSDRNVADYPWKSWRTILDSENYSSTLDSRYYTESEVNSLLDAKLNRQNLSYGNWNPRGWNLAADYHYNGGDLSISENNNKMYVSVDGCFWQNEGQCRVLDTSDVGDIRNSVTLHQYLLATDVGWYPLVWGGNVHCNTGDHTGAVYKSYDKLSWQTCSQTLYATNIQTNNIKNLSIGRGIYWNPNVESASDNTNAASITLVRSGVAGGTTLVLSQMNDTNDTIQFKTNTAARLYHNNYPILTTQNTYVSNNKGYINGLEITQVNNADTVDGYHATDGRTFNGDINWGSWHNTWSDGTHTHPWYGFDHRYPNTGAYSTTISDYFGMTIKTYNTLLLDCGTLLLNSRNNATTYQIKFPLASGTVALTSDIPTVTNYYWANVKISASSSTTTSPTVSNLTATSSIRMSNISLEYTNEINNIINGGGIYLNYRNSGSVSLCYGGGNVGIGTTLPFYKLDVNGQMRASGFHHASVNSDNYILLAGGGYRPFGGDYRTPIFLGYLNLYNGNDGTISSSFPCLGYSVPFTYTRGGSYCLINIPNTSFQTFYIKAAIASVHYSGAGMGHWVRNHRGDGAWWLHCDAVGSNAVQVQGFHLANRNNDSWWGGNPLYSGDGAAKIITVCLFGYVKFR